MKLRFIKFLSVGIGSCLVLIVGGYYMLLTQNHSKDSTPAAIRATSSVKLIKAAGIPVKINIPSIKVDTSIEIVGTTPSGDMEAPKSPLVTGWYKAGARPGTIGSAVIAGHYGDSSSGIDSAFDKLSQLKKGDEITILDDANETFTFVVSTTRTIGRNEDAQDVFISNDNKAHLNLITCHGTWQQDEQTFSDRFIVYTELKQTE